MRCPLTSMFSLHFIFNHDFTKCLSFCCLLYTGDLQDGGHGDEDARRWVDAGEANRQNIPPNGQEPRRQTVDRGIHRGRQERPLHSAATAVRPKRHLLIGSYNVWNKYLYVKQTYPFRGSWLGSVCVRQCVMIYSLSWCVCGILVHYDCIMVTQWD